MSYPALSLIRTSVKILHRTEATVVIRTDRGDLNSFLDGRKTKALGEISNTLLPSSKSMYLKRRADASSDDQ